jgi:hypothetical protein
VTTLDDLDIPLSGVEKAVSAWVEESIELRHGAAGDPEGSIRNLHPEGVAETTAALIRVRARSDRLDELLTKATRAKARAKRAKDEAAFSADAALMKATAHRATRRAEFSSGREREAEAKLDAFEERRLAHQADRLVSVTSEAYEVINQIHWQLDSIRKDLRATLHALQFESGLER